MAGFHDSVRILHIVEIILLLSEATKPLLNLQSIQQD